MKKFVKSILLFVVLSFAGGQQTADFAPISAGNPVLDLTKPSMAAVVHEFAKIFQDVGYATKYNREFEQLLPTLYELVTYSNQGFLVKIELYQAELVQYVLNSEQKLLLPIGLGNEPLDALTEFIRRPQLRPVPRNQEPFKDISYYLWVTSEGNQLNMEYVADTNNLIELAKNEAKRRELLATVKIQDSNTLTYHIQRANYWQSIATEYEKNFKTNEVKESAKQLTQNMISLQDEFNQSYQSYQALEQSIYETRSNIEVMQAFQVINTIFKTAVAVNQVTGFLTNSNSGSGTGSSDNTSNSNGLGNIDGGGSLESWHQTLNEQESEYHSISEDLTLSKQHLIKNDDELRNLYNDSEIAIPHSNPIWVETSGTLRQWEYRDAVTGQHENFTPSSDMPEVRYYINEGNGEFRYRTDFDFSNAEPIIINKTE